MTRAAIYCRYSSDLQSEKSIEDQERLCRELAARNDWRVIRVFADRAISGASTAGRPAYLDMIEAAKRGEFDIIAADDSYRLARNQADLVQLRDRLEFLGIEIHTIADGHLTEMGAGIRGLMGAMYLKSLAQNVRRGMNGVVHSGRHAGGRAYGYRSIEGKPGVLEINEPEAAIVRRIYKEFAAGESPRAICARLNGERIAPPRGKHWQPSSLNGSRVRGNGILANDLYCGRIVWNKIRMMKNPATGKRVSRPNPPAEWKTADAPHLRIIDQELWDRAQARRPRGAYTRPEQAKRPRHLLSGLLRCGSCEASMQVRGTDRKGLRIVCSQHKETGTCEHGRNYYVADIERMTLAGLSENLLSGPALDRFLETYRAERKRLAGEGEGKRRDLERRLGEIERRIQRATAAILDAGGPIKALAIELQSMESDKARIEADLAALKEARTVVSLHPAALDSYRAKVTALAATLERRDAPDAGELREAVRGLIYRVTVQPSIGGEPITLDVAGHLSRLLSGENVARIVAGNGGNGPPLPSFPATSVPLFRFRLVA